MYAINFTAFASANRTFSDLFLDIGRARGYWMDHREWQLELEPIAASNWSAAVDNILL